MRETIEGYIRAVEQNIADYMLIEDVEERQRSLDAAYGMLEDFQQVLAELEDEKPVDEPVYWC
jgi:hypothetical protein